MYVYSNNTLSDRVYVHNIQLSVCVCVCARERIAVGFAWRVSSAVG